MPGSLPKRLFGLFTLALGLFILFFVIAHPFVGHDKRFSWKMVLLGVPFGITFVFFGWEWFLDRADLDRPIRIEPGNPAIEAAKAKARAELPRLWTFLEEGKHHCFIKYPMRTEEGRPEHIWAIVHERQGDSVIASLAADPVEEPAARDARFKVAVEEIEDWQVMVSESEIRGGYTIGAMADIIRARGNRLSRGARRELAAFVDLRSGDA